MRSPDDIIYDTMSRARLYNNLAIARHIGLTRQTLARKRKYPCTFTAGEISSLARLFVWTDSELVEFVKGCEGKSIGSR